MLTGWNLPRRLLLDTCLVRKQSLSGSCDTANYKNAFSCLAFGLEINSQLDFVIPARTADFRDACAGGARHHDLTVKALLLCDER